MPASQIIRNPFPHVREATDAATRIATLTRDLYVLNAELSAITQAKRMIALASGGIFVVVMLILGFFWITQGLRDAGWSPWALAVLVFAFFGIMSCSCFLAAYLAGKRTGKRN